MKGMIISMTKDGVLLNKEYNKKEEKWSELCKRISLLGGDGEALVSALKKLHAVFGEDIPSWLGGLFDSCIGGFYYSEEAKESDGYLPDIESTYQAIVLLQASAVISEYDEIPESVRRRIAGFICSLEDPDSGYFYHPQWSRSLSDSKPSRKNRDLGWAMALSSWLDFDLPYADALTRLKSGAECADADIFSSREHFLNYLNTLDFGGKAVVSMHKLASAGNHIAAAGLEDAAADFLHSIQNTDTGLWGDGVTTDSVYVTSAALALYNRMQRRVMRAELIADTLLERFFSEVGSHSFESIAHIRNLWSAIFAVMQNLCLYSGDEGKAAADRVQVRLISLAPDAVLHTAEHISKFKRASGGFGYMSDLSPTTSQGVPVSPKNASRGDVNSSVIAVGLVRGIYASLGLEEFNPGLFDIGALEKFVDAIDKK